MGLSKPGSKFTQPLESRFITTVAPAKGESLSVSTILLSPLIYPIPHYGYIFNTEDKGWNAECVLCKATHIFPFCKAVKSGNLNDCVATLVSEKRFVALGCEGLCFCGFAPMAVTYACQRFKIFNHIVVYTEKYPITQMRNQVGPMSPFWLQALAHMYTKHYQSNIVCLFIMYKAVLQDQLLVSLSKGQSAQQVHKRTRAAEQVPPRTDPVRTVSESHAQYTTTERIPLRATAESGLTATVEHLKSRLAELETTNQALGLNYKEIEGLWQLGKGELEVATARAVSLDDKVAELTETIDLLQGDNSHLLSVQDKYREDLGLARSGERNLFRYLNTLFPTAQTLQAYIDRFNLTSVWTVIDSLQYAAEYEIAYCNSCSAFVEKLCKQINDRFPKWRSM